MGRYILYSPGYGAGWSTWNDENIRDFLLTYPPLINACLKNATPEQLIEIIEHELIPDIKEKFGEDTYIYTGGGENLRVQWVDGPFYIREYDGFESITEGYSDYIDPNTL